MAVRNHRSRPAGAPLHGPSPLPSASSGRTPPGGQLAVDVMEPADVALSAEHACLVVQQPNFFGYLEEAATLAEKAHDAGALYVVAPDPISLGMFRPPGDYGADIVVAEGQPLGIPLSFGGPYVGLFAAREKYVRQMPGRIVGRTAGRRGAHRLRADAPDARAAHSPRAGDVQHLHQRAARRAGGDRLPLRDGQAGAATGRRALLSQVALRRRARSRRCPATRCRWQARSSRSSSCAARGRRAR